MQKSMRNLDGFLHGLGSVFSRHWGCFWDPGALILSVSCRRDAIFQNFVFFMFGLIFLWFGEVLGWFGGSFWEPKGDQNGFKIWSKKLVIFGSLLEALWSAKGRVEGDRGWRQKSTGRSPPYCRANPSGRVVRNSRVWGRLAFFMSFFALLCLPFFTTFWGHFGMIFELILHLKSQPFYTLFF